MEYVLADGRKVIVDKDIVTWPESRPRKQVIGANYTHGITHGGYLSSYSIPFTDELLQIQTGIGDIVQSRLGDVNDAYKLLRSKLEGKDVNNLVELSCVVIDTVHEYFNGFANIDKRMEYYVDEDFPESENNRISNLKGSGAAMCVERAALAHNLLCLLGVKSIYKCSGIIKNGNNEVHAYNLIEFNGKYYIFDATMPNLVEGNICPIICEIDKETFDLLSNPLSEVGCSVTTSHYNPYRSIDVNITYDSKRKKQVEVDSFKGIERKMN